MRSRQARGMVSAMPKQRNRANTQRTSVELFAGGGGLAMAVEAAGFRPLLLNEFAKRACETLTLNKAVPLKLEEGDRPSIPNVGERPPLVIGDVAKVEFEYLKGHVDVLAGGPPCQPFSLGGVARGDEDERNGFPHMFRAVREMSPKAVICENVRGLLRPSFMPYFDYLKLELSLPFEKRREGTDWREHKEKLLRLKDSNALAPEERYEVFHFAVNAADYGVPQVRNRVIMVACRADLGVDWREFEKLIRPKFSNVLLYESIIDGSYWDRHPKVPRAVRERVTADAREKVSQPTLSPANEAAADRSEEFAWRTLRDALQGIDEQRPLPDIAPERLDRREYHVDGFTDHIGWPGARIYPGHTPNELDRPAKTVKAGVHGVPGGESVILLDNGSHRYMTVRETARVMTFPDDWQLAGPRGEKMRQLGNAVPVLLGRTFAEAIGAALDRAEGIK